MNASYPYLISGLPVSLAESLLAGYAACLESAGELPGIREATREEFDRVFAEIAKDQVDRFYSRLSPEEQREKMEYFLSDCDRVWGCHLHAYTYDGNQMLVTVPNRDGSAYVYLFYVDPGRRGTGMATALMRRCIADHPRGLSLHTDPENTHARGVYGHFGFSEYPSRHDQEVFMTNRPGIGGEEWLDDEEN